MSKIKANVLKLKKSDSVLLALSGGLDSMVLLDLLDRARKETGFHLAVAHINHNLRKESEYEEIFLRNYCSERKIDFYVKNLNPNDLLVGIEEEARNQRYKFLSKIAQREGFNIICTAHHQNDQVETVLLHLFRGSGPKGLEGISEESYLTKTKLYRPLLEFSKKDLKLYAEFFNIPYFNDLSNFESKFTRNIIRNEVLPEIQKQFPKVQEKLIQTSQLIKKENDFVRNIVNYLFDKWIKINDGVINFNPNLFLNLEQLLEEESLNYLDQESRNFLIKELIRESLNQINRLKDFNQTVIENLLEFFGSKKAGRLDLPNNLIAIIASGNYLIGSKNILNKQIGFYILNDIKYKSRDFYFAKENLLLKIKRGKLKEFKLPDKNERRIVLPVNKVPDELIIRPRQTGDRIFIEGIQKYKKLSRFFIDQKVPFYLRESIPVVSSKDKIVWIPNYYLNSEFKVTNTDEDVLELTFIELNTEKER